MVQPYATQSEQSFVTCPAEAGVARAFKSDLQQKTLVRLRNDLTFAGGIQAHDDPAQPVAGL